MTDRLTLLECLMDSLKDRIVFVDPDHTIQYMNKAAVEHYRGKPANVGRPIFDCHNENSNSIIRDVFEAFQDGEDERLISVDDEQHIYMRAVRSETGELLGYYERFEPV